jgi:hypothetical protein
MFAPCEKVIIGQGDNSVSLIGILQNLHLNPRPDTPAQTIPANAALPLSWAIFTLWQRTEDDEGKSYTQRVALESPAGRSLVESVTPFSMEKDFHRIANSIIGLPIGESGTSTLKLWLRSDDSADWNEMSSFPLLITHPAITPASSRTH